MHVSCQFAFLGCLFGTDSAFECRALRLDKRNKKHVVSHTKPRRARRWMTFKKKPLWPLCEIELGCGPSPALDARQMPRPLTSSPSSLLPPSSWSARPPATSHQSIAYQKKGFPRFGGNPYASPHISSILRKHVLSCCHLTSPVRQNGARGYVSSLYLFSCFGGHVPIFFCQRRVNHCLTFVLGAAGNVVFSVWRKAALPVARSLPRSGKPLIVCVGLSPDQSISTRPRPLSRLKSDGLHGLRSFEKIKP